MQQSRVLAAVVVASLSVGTASLATGGSAGASPIPASSAHPSTKLGSLTERAMKLVAAARGAAGLRSPRSVLRLPARSMLASALPTSADVSDLIGDNGPVLDPYGDLVDTGIATDKTTFAVGSFTDLFDDPSTSANWANPNTVMEWGLDVNKDGTPDYIVIMFNDVADGFGVISGVLNGAATNVLCAATPSWDSTDNGYFAVFDRSCVQSPAQVQAQGYMDYQDSSGDSIDYTAWTPAIGLPTPVVQQQTHSSGYWMLGSDGHVYPFGAAVGFSGSVPQASAMAPRKDGKGYWVVDREGHVFAYGSARFFGGTPPLAGGEFVSTISATPSGGGYWLFTNRGRSVPFGNASGYGDMSGMHLNGPIIASVATPSGHGYYMVGSDGGIFSFGDARFHGSTGNLHLNKPVVGISPTADGKGYWLVASDGGVFAFSAPFRGSMGGAHLNKAVDGLVAFGNGYLMAASDGGIFDFSNKRFLGSLGGKPLAAPIIGLAAFSS